MALLNGQTPAQLSKEIVNAAISKFLVEIDGVTSQHLDVLARKDNKDSIEARGEKFWSKNRDHFREEMVSKLINNTHKQLVKYLDKREEEMSLKYYKSLIASGMQANEAHKLAFNGTDKIEDVPVTENKPETK